MSTNLSLTSGLQNANTRFDTGWQIVYQAAKEGVYRAYSQIFPGNGAGRVELDFIANSPVMRKWTGSRRSKTLRHYSQAVQVESYEATLKLKRKLVQYDQSGAVGQAIDTFLQQNVPAIEASVVASYDSASGAGPTGFDGVALFHASHPHGPAGATTQGNIGAGTNLSHASMRAAVAAGRLLKFENGEPAHVSYDTMRVGPQLETRAKELLSADRVQPVKNDGTLDGTSSIVAGATRSNVFQGAMTLIVDERVSTYYTDFIDTKRGPVRPMFVLMGMEPGPTLRTTTDDPEVFNTDNFIWGLLGDWGVAAGHWLTAYRLTGTA